MTLLKKHIPQAGDGKGDGSSPNAQSFMNPTTCGDFAHFTPKASPDNDSEASPPTEEQDEAEEEHFRDQAEKRAVSKRPAKDNPGLQRFKAGVQSRSKNTCRLCGMHFEIPLKIGYPGGYICEPCRRDGPPEPKKADAQTVLVKEYKPVEVEPAPPPETDIKADLRQAEELVVKMPNLDLLSYKGRLVAVSLEGRTIKGRLLSLKDGYLTILRDNGNETVISIHNVLAISAINSDSGAVEARA